MAIVLGAICRGIFNIVLDIFMLEISRAINWMQNANESKIHHAYAEQNAYLDGIHSVNNWIFGV